MKEWIYNAIHGYEQHVVAALLFVLALDAADRTLIGALGPTLKRVFNLTNTELGLLVTVVAFASAFATLPIGALADRFSRTGLLAGSLLLWVVAEGATGAAVGFAMLFGARIFLGIISATSGPTQPSLVGDIVPARRRAGTFGSITSGQLVGTALGFLLPVIILSFTTWRGTFWTLAVAGGVLAFAFWRLREPQRTGAAGPGERGPQPQQDSDKKLEETNQHVAPQTEYSKVQQLVRQRHVPPASQALVYKDATDISFWGAVKYVWEVRTDLVVLISRSVGDFFFQAIGTFAVVYATSWYHLGLREADLVFLVVGIGAVTGVFFVGWLGDKLLKRGWLTSRVWMGAIAYMAAPFALFPAFRTQSLWFALPLYAIGAFLLVGAAPPLDAARVDVLLPRLRGRAEAIRQTARTIMEGSAPLLIGWLSDHIAGGGTIGLQWAILITLPGLFLAGLVLLVAVRTYPGDVAAALQSSEAQEDIQEDKQDDKQDRTHKHPQPHDRPPRGPRGGTRPPRREERPGNERRRHARTSA